MSKMSCNTGVLKDKTIYVIVSAASKMRYTDQIIQGLISLGTSCVIVESTPNAARALKSLKLITSPNILIPEDKEFRLDASRSTYDLPEADAVIVAPATFNMVSKIALGIADSNVLTQIATAISKKSPVILAPSYDTMWEHPLNMQYLNLLRSWGVNVILPDLELDHITMAPVAKIIDTLQSRFSKVKFESHKIDGNTDLDMILNGLREKYFDEFRCIGLQSKQDGANNGVNGCASVRVGDWALVTATGSYLADLGVTDLTLVSIDNSIKNKKVHWYGDKTPSSETPLHLSLYDKMSGVHAIVHTHCNTITYNPDYSELKTKNYISYGEFENLTDLIALVKQDGFGIMRLHGEIAVGLSIEKAYANIKSYIPAVTSRKSA